MHRILSRRGRISLITAFTVILLATTFLASLTPKAKATATPTIIIDPISGPIGTEIKINGTIDSLNGSYTIRWDQTLNITTGYAKEYNVTTSFIIPQTVGVPFPGREVQVELIDNNKTADNVANATFELYTAYYIRADTPSHPLQLQQGDTTSIWVNVTGGESNTVYTANITVSDPANEAYWATTLLTNTTTTGYGEGNALYPTDFGTLAHTNFTGTYEIAFNKTDGTALASSNFTAGLTNAVEYHRFQVVNIHAANYTQPSEWAWVNTTRVETGETVYSENCSATDGIVEASWEIPWNASLGLYTVAIANSTAPGTVKPVPDTQNFTVMEKVLPLSLNPFNGSWGAIVTVVGEIVKLGGPYEIRWDGQSVKTGSCTPGSVVVNDTFIVPTSVEGDHNVTLYDINQTLETTPSIFKVTTSCHVLAQPDYIQEGLNTTITISLDGAKENTYYAFSISVTDPVGSTWTVDRSITTDDAGSGNSQTEYWGEFEGAHTDFVGSYSIAVNASLLSGSFTVGLTDKQEYRRSTIAWIRGSGYNANETVTVNIKIAGSSVANYPTDETADPKGVVTHMWRIFGNATLGIHVVTLASPTVPDLKPVPDSQSVPVLEIIVYCQAQNKYEISEPVGLAGVKVEAIGPTKAEGISNKTGWVDFRLDRGNYTFKVSWKEVQVGVLNQSVTGNATEYILIKTFHIECELTHITIATYPRLPFINITLTSNKTTESFETNNTGIIATNTFAGVPYRIEARRYGHLFFNQSIGNLTVSRWVDVTIPTYNLFVNALDSKGQPLQNVDVNVIEWSSGVPMGSGTTNNWGSVTFSFIFGRYKVRVYNGSALAENSIVLNETVVDLIEDQFFLLIHCNIYNVDLSVSVIDYFGQPIPNAVVKVERDGVEIASSTTEEHGTASLQEIIGGSCRVSLYILGKLCETKTLYLDSDRELTFKIAKYIVIGGYPLEIVQFVALASLSILVAVFALALVYRKIMTTWMKKKEKTTA